MLKTRVGEEVWLVQQPDHARLAGYLAAHWGGAGGFARPGSFAPADRPAELRQEVIQAVAEHDNGWWEWEAAPPIDPADGWPLGLVDVGRQNPDESLRRWRLGVPRLAETHPYVALLISLHAYWLYAFAFDAEAPRDDALRHPLFGRPDRVTNLVPDPDRTRAFLAEQEAVRRELLRRLRENPRWAAATDPAHLHPHLKLLQVLDAMSLLVSFGAGQPHELPDVPRGGWNDRCVLKWRPVSGNRIACDPFPFDTDPLEITLPVRVVPAGTPPPTGPDLPLTRLHALPLRMLRFELTGSA